MAILILDLNDYELSYHEVCRWIIMKWVTGTMRTRKNNAFFIRKWLPTCELFEFIEHKFVWSDLLNLWKLFEWKVWQVLSIVVAECSHCLSQILTTPILFNFFFLSKQCTQTILFNFFSSILVQFAKWCHMALESNVQIVIFLTIYKLHSSGEIWCNRFKPSHKM